MRLLVLVTVLATVLTSCLSLELKYKHSHNHRRHSMSVLKGGEDSDEKTGNKDCQKGNDCAIHYGLAQLEKRENTRKSGGAGANEEDEKLKFARAKCTVYCKTIIKFKNCAQPREHCEKSCKDLRTDADKACTCEESNPEKIDCGAFALSHYMVFAILAVSILFA
eukprot:Platyproteum_vivax@DN2330_c0_g1_i1.p1